MKVFLVGGAVRDRCLGLAIKDRDWVVVGATAEQMQAQGFRPVGRDFPVFLHPQSQEEYALARQERKQGHGYHGFVTHHGPEVSLEQDLLRRDLTINAMAEDEEGRIIDPYGGLQDLAQRRLRHVSPAFAEDPLRVLRVARFAARYHALGFTIAPETLALMRQITASGELQHLAPERVWQELQRALLEQHPATFFQSLHKAQALAALFPELAALEGVPQNPQYHPEVDTWLHTCLALDQAAVEGYQPEVRFAVLTHDLGKALTPREEWPHHRQHEERGLVPLLQLCQRLHCPKSYQELARLCCRWHLQVHQALNLRAQTLLKLIEYCDGLRQSQRFKYLLQACCCDARGRHGHAQKAYPQLDYLLQALEVARQTQIAPLLERGLSGGSLGTAIRDQRLQQLARFRKQYTLSQ